MARDRERTPDVRIEFPSRGATYCRNEYGVYRYDTYPRHSVLAGQTRRTFLNQFPTLDAARAAYPAAVADCAPGYTDINAVVAHLPDEDDPRNLDEYFSREG